MSISIEAPMPIGLPVTAAYSVAWKPADRLDGSVRAQVVNGAVTITQGSMTVAQLYNAIRSDVEAQMLAQGGHTAEEGPID